MILSQHHKVTVTCDCSSRGNPQHARTRNNIVITQFFTTEEEEGTNSDTKMDTIFDDVAYEVGRESLLQTSSETTPARSHRKLIDTIKITKSFPPFYGKKVQ